MASSAYDLYTTCSSWRLAFGTDHISAGSCYNWGLKSMRNTSNNITNLIASFLGLVIFIALLVCAIIFFSYFFIIGAIIGLILFIIGFIRSKLQKNHPKTLHDDGKTHRIIDQDK